MSISIPQITRGANGWLLIFIIKYSAAPSSILSPQWGNVTNIVGNNWIATYYVNGREKKLPEGASSRRDALLVAVANT